MLIWCDEASRRSAVPARTKKERPKSVIGNDEEGFARTWRTKTYSGREKRGSKTSCNPKPTDHTSRYRYGYRTVVRCCMGALYGCARISFQVPYTLRTVLISLLPCAQAEGSTSQEGFETFEQLTPSVQTNDYILLSPSVQTNDYIIP